MRFSKPALTPRQQLDRLIDHDLQVRDVNRALRLLEVTSYFRLIPYMRPFQRPTAAGRRFQAETGLERIYSLYQFDSRLRQLTMVAVERVEVAVRAAISNHMAATHGTHWYRERRRFVDGYKHDDLVRGLQSQMEKEHRKFSRERENIERSQASRETKGLRIEHRMRDNYFRFYAETYTDPQLPPAWAMAEELSLGGISHLYSGLARDWDRKQIARYFQIPQRVLASWLHTLTFTRNICAHHARLWNRELSVPPRWDRRLPEPDGGTDPHPPRRFFTVAAILTYLCWHVSPDSHWPQSLVALMNDFPDVPRGPMGFPEDWPERLREYQHNNP
ncbi:MAG: Abi family protein [Xanthomonadales bacterium]|nr:Abi family protein [Xanthomonadales bacterium]